MTTPTDRARALLRALEADPKYPLDVIEQALRDTEAEVRERMAKIADDEAHGNALAAGSIGLGGNTRAHSIMSARADTARQIAAAIREVKP